MNSLVDAYLSNPHKRREVARELQHRVLSDFTFHAFATRVLVGQPVWRNTQMPAEELAVAGAGS
jgi:hypothetical protein